jgi:hypothetical protein
MKVGEFQPAAAGLRMISANSRPPALFPASTEQLPPDVCKAPTHPHHDVDAHYAEWHYHNVRRDRPQIPHLNPNWTCKEEKHATEPRIFFLAEHRHVLVVRINVCLQCQTVDSVDTDFDLFLGAVPPKNRPGFGLAVCTVRAYYHQLCNNGQPLAHMRDSIIRDANWPAISALLRAEHYDAAAQIDPKVVEDPSRIVSYDRLQKTMFACLARFELYRTLRQGCSCGCGKHDPRKDDMVVVVDMVHVGMPSNVKPQE